MSLRSPMSHPSPFSPSLGLVFSLLKRYSQISLDLVSPACWWWWWWWWWATWRSSGGGGRPVGPLIIDNPPCLCPWQEVSLMCNKTCQWDTNAMVNSMWPCPCRHQQWWGSRHLPCHLWVPAQPQGIHLLRNPFPGNHQPRCSLPECRKVRKHF